MDFHEVGHVPAGLTFQCILSAISLAVCAVVIYFVWP